MSDHPKFEPFHVHDLVYKTINSVPAKCAVLVPKVLPDPSKTSLPVILRWQAGSLTTGHRLYHRWFTDWTVALALRVGAAIICPDHRLIPEANGADILSDVKDFYTWLTPANISPGLPPGRTADLSHMLLCGESSGGWVSLQSLIAGLVPRHRIAALVLQFPMLDVGDRHFTEDYEKNMYAGKVGTVPHSVLADHIASLKGDEVVTEATPPERLELALSVLQQGRIRALIGGDESMLPLEALKGGKAELPPTWVYHGNEDDVVPKSGTEKFVAIMREHYPAVEVLEQYPSGNHGFDVGYKDPLLDEEWIREGEEFIGKFWPAK